MKQTEQTARTVHALALLGVSIQHVTQLRRIASTLQRWAELECGTDRGCIERDEKTGKPRWYNANARFVQANDPRAYHSIPDREAGAEKRLAKIMAEYPALWVYRQTDPRGCPLYIGRKSDVNGTPLDQVYNRGVAVG